MNEYQDSLNWLNNQASKVEKNNSCTIISTIRLQKLVERATPKKPKLYAKLKLRTGVHKWVQCPMCSGEAQDIDGNKYNYCPKCGQRLE